MRSEKSNDGTHPRLARRLDSCRARFAEAWKYKIKGIFSKIFKYFKRPNADPLGIRHLVIWIWEFPARIGQENEVSLCPINLSPPAL